MSYEELTENTDQLSVTGDDTYDDFDISRLKGVKVVTLEEYKRKTPHELDLEIGQTIKQVREANKDGLAYGYIRKGKFNRKKYGLYPVNIVALKVASQDVKYTTPVETLDNDIPQTTSVEGDDKAEVRRIFCDQTPVNTHFQENENQVERIFQMNTPAKKFNIDEMSFDSLDFKSEEKNLKEPMCMKSFLNEQSQVDSKRPGSKPLLAFLGKPVHSNENKSEKAPFQKHSKNPFRRLFKKK